MFSTVLPTSWGLKITGGVPIFSQKPLIPAPLPFDQLYMFRKGFQPNAR